MRLWSFLLICALAAPSFALAQADPKAEVRAVLDEQQLPLSKVLNLKVGDTLMLNALPDSDISVRCGSIPVTTGKMGRKGQHIAVRIEAPISVEAATSLTKGRR